MSSYRYRSPELPYGVTREAIGWLGPGKQRGVIVAWVEENFDLLNSDHVLFEKTDSFDVFEQVHDEFDGLVPSDIINSAVAELSYEGEWVSRQTPRLSQIELYDTERLSELLIQAQTRRTRLGAFDELDERAKLQGVISKLQRSIVEIEGIVGRIGSNGGPADVSSPAGQFAHVVTHIAKIGKQAASAAPDPLSVAQSALAIQGIAAQNDWLDEKMQEGAAAYIRSFCETAGKDHARLLSVALGIFIFLVFELLSACIGWLEIATAH